MSVIWRYKLYVRRGGPRIFALCSNSNEVLSSNVDPLKTEPSPSSLPGYCSEHPFCLLVPGLYLLATPLLVEALLFPWQLCWPPPPHECTSSLLKGFPTASSTEQDYLFLTFLKKDPSFFLCPDRKRAWIIFKFLSLWYIVISWRICNLTLCIVYFDFILLLFSLFGSFLFEVCYSSALFL